MTADPLLPLRTSPFSPFYNLEGLTDVFLTCDADWAPEYAIAEVLREVQQRDMWLTLFATGPSQLLGRPPSWLEVGLHPDFTRRSGPWIDERFAALKEIYPDAVGTRSHRNYFGQNIADAAHAIGLKYDASSVMFNQPFAQAQVDYNGMTRFSYCWEDGLHLDMQLALDLSCMKIDTPGMKILNVHPVLIYLNSESDDHRRAVTRRYANLADAPERELAAERNRGRGIAHLWRELLDELATRGIRTHNLRDALP